MPRLAACVFDSNVNLPESETYVGTKVYHPRYFVIPKAMRFLHGLTLGWSLRRLFKSIYAEFPFELISAHWLYPDAYAATLANRESGIPVVCHALGCDINEYLRFPLRRRMIRWSLHHSSAIVTKSQELADKIGNLLGNSANLNVIYNGIDREMFHQIGKKEARRSVGFELDSTIVLFVGNLAPEKAISVLLEAFAQLVSRQGLIALYIVGDGPLEKQLKSQSDTLGLSDFVTFLGKVPHRRISTYLNAADVLCLPSLREGCPNVVLESLACGTAVVASAVGAVPEMVSRAKNGFLVRPGDVADLAEKLQAAVSRSSDGTREFRWPSWEENAESVGEVFDACLADGASTRNHERD
jgi:glycosyltransferase involved in cell wall biosynthesis